METFKVVPKNEVSGIDPDSLPWIVVKTLEPEVFMVGEAVLINTKERVFPLSSHSTKGAADKALRKTNKQPPELPKSEEKTFTYQLSLTEAQAQLLVRALDLFSRIGMGQLEEIAHVLRLNPGSPTEKIDAVAALAREAATSFMGNAGAYFGIFSPKISDAFRIAWDLQQVIRHRLAWDRNPKGGIQVDFDDPVKSSKEPLATITRT